MIETTIVVAFMLDSQAAWILEFAPFHVILEHDVPSLHNAKNGEFICPVTKEYRWACRGSLEWKY